MLWRQSYETLTLAPFAMPKWEGICLGSGKKPSAGILLGSFGLGDFRDREVWRKLINEDLPGLPWLQVDFHLGLSDLKSLVPASLWEKSWSSPSAAVWEGVLPYGRVFSLIFVENEVLFGMVGPSTEEAWDAFRKAADGFLRVQ